MTTSDEKLFSLIILLSKTLWKLQNPADLNLSIISPNFEAKNSAKNHEQRLTWVIRCDTNKDQTIELLKTKDLKFLDNISRNSLEDLKWIGVEDHLFPYVLLRISLIISEASYSNIPYKSIFTIKSPSFKASSDYNPKTTIFSPWIPIWELQCFNNEWIKEMESLIEGACC